MQKPGNRLLTWVGVAALGCAAVGAQEPAKPDAPKKTEDVAAYVGTETISTQELDARALKTNMKLAQSLYDARKAVLDQMILEKILASEAAQKGVSVDNLIGEKLKAKAAPVTDEQVEAYYKANSARMGGRTLEQVSAQIRASLAQQGERAAKDALLDELKTKAGVRVALDPPRVEVPVAANDPMKGSAAAKITIVEFSEFQ